ncbi:MAG TPA: hypothetical protein VN554_01125, partial [Verrucomicrobiae bacterium]|nr:hypothetical protein [Verrucomicrobiae bacterium]
MSKSRTEVNRHFHGDVDIGSGISADYVVAHGERQQQRGRNPSIAYRGITNPREALAVARADVNARRSEAEGTDPHADFAGRVLIMRVWSEAQRELATAYAQNRIDEDGAIGAIIQDVEPDEELQAPLYYRATD